MTLPSITYGTISQDDLGDKSDYTEHEDGASATLTVDNGTVFNIDVSAAVGNKKVYYEIDITDVDGTIYTKGMVRFRTSSSSIKAKVEFVFDDATTEVVMAETDSTDWTTFLWTQSASKTVSKIRLYATSATGNVYYDFWSIYKGTQTFHNFDDLDVNPRVKTAELPIFGSDTNVTQHGGRDNTIITIEGPMRAKKDWGSDYATTSVNFGEFLKQVLYDRYFQWFTSDQGNFKVMPDPLGTHFRQSKNQDYQLRYILVLKEYDVGDASIFTGKAWYT